MKRILLLFFGALLLVGCSGDDANTSDQADEHATAETAAKADEAQTAAVHDLTLTTLDGSTINLGDYAGEIILVDFWATWCGPCLRVLPSLQQMHDDLADKGVRIVALATDRKGASVVGPFIAKHGYTFPVVLMNQQAFNVFGEVNSIPTTFIIKGDGTIAEKMVGAHPKKDYLAAIERARS